MRRFGGGCLNRGYGIQVARFRAPKNWHILKSMRAVLVLLLLASQPFWEAKPAGKWSDREVEMILHASPWAQVTGVAPEVTVYIATAEPIREAESELRVRSRRPVPELDPDYVDYLREHADSALAIAIPYPNAGFGSAADQHQMEAETKMIVGARQYDMLGYFPPTPSDPVLRLMFPRQVRPSDKTVDFRLFLPGISFPEREVQFRVKDLYYKGKLSL